MALGSLPVSVAFDQACTSSFAPGPPQVLHKPHSAILTYDSTSEAELLNLLKVLQRLSAKLEHRIQSTCGYSGQTLAVPLPAAAKGKACARAVHVVQHHLMPTWAAAVSFVWVMTLTGGSTHAQADYGTCMQGSSAPACFSARTMRVSLPCRTAAHVTAAIPNCMCRQQPAHPAGSQCYGFRSRYAAQTHAVRICALTFACQHVYVPHARPFKDVTAPWVAATCCHPGNVVDT